MNEYEEVLSGQESLQLITNMINKAKCDFVETGISALMWGSVITFCALVQFASYFYHIPGAGYVWLLTDFAVIPQIIIAVRESKKRRFKTHEADAMSGIWISFAIMMVLYSFYVSAVQVPYDNLHPVTIFLVVYGSPTFATGITRHFTPMIIGGIACWLLAIASFFSIYPYDMLYYVAAAQLAWFIPGLILQRRYYKAKQQHV